MAAVTICSDFGAQKKSATVSTVYPYICHEVIFFQNSSLEGHALNLPFKNSKIATTCLTTIDRRMLDLTKKKDSPYPGAKEKPQQHSGKGATTFKIKPQTCQRCSEVEKPNLCTPGPKGRSSDHNRLNWSCLCVFKCLLWRLGQQRPGRCSMWHKTSWRRSSFSSVAQSCLTLCDLMDRSTPGLPVHHQLPEFTQTHAHWVGDHPTISSSVILFSSCLQSFSASGSFQMSQFFASGGQSIGV